MKARLIVASTVSSLFPLRTRYLYKGPTTNLAEKKHTHSTNAMAGRNTREGGLNHHQSTLHLKILTSKEVDQKDEHVHDLDMTLSSSCPCHVWEDGHDDSKEDILHNEDSQQHDSIVCAAGA